MEIKTRLNKDGAFPVNQQLAGIVPMASTAEQAILTEDIARHEQREPITLWRGEVVDGRCRQQALVTLGKHILYKELDEALTVDEVRVYVKSVNTRRNLTPTQKIMIACRSSLEVNGPSIGVAAKAWGVSDIIVKNARYITRVRPDIAEELFNGKSVEVIDDKGQSKLTNKVTVVYAYLRKLEEAVVEDTAHAWQADTYIKAQAGKEWYYDIVQGVSDVRVRMALAELANYKFGKPDN